MNYLVQNPDKLEALVADVRGAFQSADEMNCETVKELPYLNAVLWEALRLCPPIPYILPRVVPPGGATVAGVWLPGGVSRSLSASAQSQFVFLHVCEMGFGGSKAN